MTPIFKDHAKVCDACCRVAGSHVMDVSLVDLAWAGLEAHNPTFPPFINHEHYAWPDGVCTGARLSRNRVISFLTNSLHEYQITHRSF